MDSLVRHRRVISAWASVCAFVAVALFTSQLLEIRARSALRGYDNTFNYLWLRSAMIDHDWDFRNDLIECDTLQPDYRASALTLPVTRVGRIPNKYGVGWAVVTLPTFLVADLVVWIGHATGGWHFPRDGFSAPYQVCIQIGHALLAMVSLFLAMRVVVEWVGDRLAGVVGVVMIWAASPLLYYQTTNLSMSHGVGFFSVATLAAALNEISKENENNRTGARVNWLWVLAGAAWALGTVTRFQLAVFGVAAAWMFFRRSAPSEPRDSARGRAGLRPAFVSRTRVGQRPALPSFVMEVVAFAVGAAPLFVLQTFAWHSVYGEWWLFSYGAEGEAFHWGNPELVSSLFSSWHGLFYWHPLLLLAFAGMTLWAFRARGVALAWMVGVLLTLYVSAAWWCWWFASSFGNRSYDAAILPMMAGIAWIFQRANERWRTALLALGIVAGTWNFYLVLLYRSGAISRHEPVSWSEMIAAAARLREAVQF